MNNVLFIDIETAPEYKTFDDVPQHGKDAFMRKFRYSQKFDKLSETLPLNQIWEELYQSDASFHAEFSKILVISGGLITDKDQLYIRSITGNDNELVLLQEFIRSIDKSRANVLCAHNGKVFDFPFICRRMVKHGIDLPPLLNIFGLKPWEQTTLIDTMDAWKFGDLKHYSSILSLTYALNLPSPKTEMDGSMVAESYYNGKLEDIAKYCNKDVFALVNVYQRIKGLNTYKEYIDGDQTKEKKETSAKENNQG